MGLSVDIARIVRAELVPFKVDESQYGIGWKLDDGRDGADLIGTKAEAEALLREIDRATATRQQDNATASVLPFPKDTAAS